jgi:TM2 domain-containing membrane protein YozV
LIEGGGVGAQDFGGEAARAQDARAQGDSLYRAGQYFDASIAYERILFESHDEAAQLAAIFGKTRCLKQQGLYDQAMSFLENWQAYPFPDSSLAEIHYQQALCTYLGGHFENLLSLVDRWAYEHHGRQPPPMLVVLKTLSLNELGRWKEAAETYHAFIAQRGAGVAPPDLYQHIPHLKNVEKAQWLSQFIPGAGQFYAGKPLEGIFSMAVQGVGIWFAVVSFEQHYYISAWLIGAALFGAFHMGGVRRAEVLARQYNRKKTLAFNEAVREQLLSLLERTAGHTGPGTATSTVTDVP